MKKILLALITLIFFAGILNAQVIDGVKRNAERKTTQEISKKVNKGIEGIFNKKKKNKKKDKEKEQEEPTETNKQKEEVPKENPEESKTSDSAETPGEAPKPVLTTRKTDFIPGTMVLFEDNLEGELLGEFPSKWDLYRGNVENAQFGEEQVISFASSQSRIFPLMDKEAYLPEVFTIELEVYFHNKGNEAYYIDLEPHTQVYVRANQLSCKQSKGDAQQTNREPGWRHVAISFNKRALKAYLNGERLVNIPNIKERPVKFALSALSYGSSSGQPSMVKNIRVAEGGVPLYNRLQTEGKIVTNDIHFESGKATLKAGTQQTIQQITRLMLEHPELRFSIEGHTDSDGTEAFNLTLSENRAKTVKSVLVANGIEEDRMETKGFGESQPIESNENQEGKAMNRRVEFVLLK